jgi:replicative DNA helicase
MVDPQRIGACIERLKEGGDVFYDLRHQAIYEIFLELFEDGEPIDVVSVMERLKLWNKLEQVGGIAYLSQLPDAVPSVENLPNYLDIISGKHTMRKMIRACTEAVARIYDHEGDVDELMDQVERDVLKISESRVQPSKLTMPVLVHEALTDIESAVNGNGEPQGMKTGFTDFDYMTDGLHPGEMIVLAARPGLGKTSLALNIAEHVACSLQLPVGIISLEMTGKELVKRMLSSRARVNIRNIRNTFNPERDLPKITSAAVALTHAPILIDDAAGQSILAIRAKARRWWQQEHIKLLIIDYLQLANAEGGHRKFDSRQAEVSMISVGIKNLAKELGIPVIALCQLNRDIEREKNRKPRLSDLRESGSLEQDSDVVGMLYKPKTEEDDTGENDYAEPINLLIAKQRSGPTGDVNLTFMKLYTRFESAAKVNEEDVPQESASYAEPSQQEFYGEPLPDQPA